MSDEPRLRYARALASIFVAYESVAGMPASTTEQRIVRYEAMKRSLRIVRTPSFRLVFPFERSAPARNA